ncbi:MAG: phenylacetate--CoA ligase family protein [Nitrososphaerota archaeon]|nr:phenylacetate--CoA ligase family protein [Nitrososphaerota archaeon]
MPLVLKNLAEARRNYLLRRDQLEDLQRRKLLRMLRWAYAYIPLYRSLFRQIGKTPEDFQRASDLRRLPTTTKADLLANYRDGVTARGMRPEVVWSTAGTTGGPFKVEWTSEMDDVRKALSMRRMLNFGFRPWEKVATIWPKKIVWRHAYDASGRRRASTTVYELPFATAFGRPAPTVRVIVSGPPDLTEEVKALNKFGPRFVYSSPGHLQKLAEAAKSGKLAVNLKGIFLTGRDISPTSRKELEGAYGAPTCRSYGATETGSLGGDCTERRGFHLSEDYTYCEVLRGDEPVGPGEVGELVVTTLHNGIMPLVRYRLGDLVELADGGRCGCGSSLTRVSSILGRASDGILTKAGERIPPLRTVVAIEASTSLREFQVRQTCVDSFTVNVPQGGASGPGLEERLSAVLGAQVGTAVRVSLKETADFDLEGKARSILSDA